MQINWIYVLLGNNNTGKTTFQKSLLEHITNKKYDRLPSRLIHDINHPGFKKNKTIFIMGRSLQENKFSLKYFFKNKFRKADICIFSSHITNCQKDIENMIKEAHLRRYNVCGIFFSNQDYSNVPKITLMKWDLKINFTNPLTDQNTFKKQINKLSKEFINYIKR